MIFLTLLLAHLIADFILQPDWLIAWKMKSWKGVLVHAGIHGFLYLVFLAAFGQEWGILAILVAIAVLHFCMDVIKIQTEKEEGQIVKFFLMDQEVHLLVLLLASFGLKRFPALALFDIIDVGTLQFYGILYLILAIIVTYGLEIFQFQFVLQKKPASQFHLNVLMMVRRLLIFSFFYGILVVLMLRR